jgi:hypothetical protein
MAIQLVNVGLIENDGTGDDLREAFVKVNDNFSELSMLITEYPTVSNIGSGIGIFAEKENYDLKFKSLIAGDSITITPSNTTISISVTEIVNKINLEADIGNDTVIGNYSLSIIGEDTISTELVNNSLKIKTSFNRLSDDALPVLSATLDANNFSIVNLSSINNTSLENFNKVIGNNFDFGLMNFEIKNIIDWIVYNTTVDLGSFTQPAPVTIDIGMF